MGSCHFFYYFTFQFSHIYFFGSSVFWVTHARIFMFSSKCQSLVPKPSVICTFLIHSSILQKMLTALFNLVWNTQKRKWTIFLSAKAKCFWVLKRFQKRLVGTNVKCTALLFFSTSLRYKGVTFLLSYNLRNIIKQNWH